MIRFPLGALCAVCCLLCAAAFADAGSNSEKAKPGVGVTVAVADFSGSDKELGRFLADTLLTDLAQSERLALVERTQIGKALTELKLQSSGLTEPQQVKRLGRLLRADRLIVGSYFAQDNRLFINARLLDVATGRLMPNGGANVEGASDDVLALVRRLARQLHRRVTGEDLPLAGEEFKDESKRLAKPLPETSTSYKITEEGPIAESDAPDRASASPQETPPAPPAPPTVLIDLQPAAPMPQNTDPPRSETIYYLDIPFRRPVYSTPPIYPGRDVGFRFPSFRAPLVTRRGTIGVFGRIRRERPYAPAYHPHRAGFHFVGRRR